MAETREKGLNALPMKAKVLLIALCPALVIILCTVVIILYAGSLVDEGVYNPAEAAPVYLIAAPKTEQEKIDTVNALLNTIQTDGETQIESSESVDLCNMTSTFNEAQANLLIHTSGNIESAMADFTVPKTLSYGKTAELFPALSTEKVAFEQSDNFQFIFTAETENPFEKADFAVFDKTKSEFMSISNIEKSNIAPVSCTAVYTVDPIAGRLTDLAYTRTYHLEYTITFTGDLAELGTVDIAFDAIFSSVHSIKKAGIHVEQEQIVLHKTGYEALNRTLNVSSDASPEDYTLTFTSSDESIATVDEKGQVEAVALSETPVTITATLEYLGKTYTDTCEVFVINEPERVKMISKAQTIKIGDSLQLEAQVLPKNATIKSIIWYSTDESIAKVDENGVVKAVAPGKVQIIAVSKIGSYMAGCDITVEGGDK